MHSKILIGDWLLPSYGVSVLTGVLLANVIAIFIAVKRKICLETFLVLEIYGGIGAMVAAKLWFYLEQYGLSDFDIERMLSGGWSFYGGFFGGLLTVVLVCKWNRFDREKYVNHFIFLVPLVHGFWKIGCHLAGCCYGIRYDGPMALHFPKGSIAPSGVGLFPVQILEAIALFGLAVLFYLRGKKKMLKFPISMYIISYGILRVVLEWLRYRENARFFTNAQIVALLSVILSVVYVILKQRRKNFE